MIRINADSTLNASVSGLVVYLDNWAIGNLAEGDLSRRARFIRVIRSGVDLLFSAANAAELSGPQGQSADAIKDFLNELGPNWFPAELDTIEVVKREASGMAPNRVCVSRNLLVDYLNFRMRDYPPRSGKVIAMSDDFFRLGSVLDWAGPQRDSIRRSSADMDRVLQKRISEHFGLWKANSRSLDEKLPPISFSPERPGCSYGNSVCPLRYS